MIDSRLRKQSLNWISILKIYTFVKLDVSLFYLDAYLTILLLSILKGRFAVLSSEFNIYCVSPLVSENNAVLVKRPFFTEVSP